MIWSHGKKYVGTQVSRWDFQNKGRLQVATSCFVLEVPTPTVQLAPQHPWFCTMWPNRVKGQEPITRSLQLPHIPATARSIFSLNLSRFQIPTGTSVTNYNHNHGVMLTWRHVHVRPHCFILTETRWCRLEPAYLAGKISKNRLVCKNAVASAYYGSCRLLVKDSWKGLFYSQFSWV